MSRGVTLTTLWSPGALLRLWDVMEARRTESRRAWEHKRLHSALTGLGVDGASASASMAAAALNEGESGGGGGACSSGECRHH